MGLNTPANAAPATQTDDVLSYGDRRVGRFNFGTYDEWFFTGTVGDVVNIKTEGAVDTILEVYDSADNLLVRNDNFSPDVSYAQISYYVLPATNTYKVIVTRNEMTDAAYHIMLTGGPRHIGTLEFGTTQTGRVPEDGVDLWQFSANAGDTISVSVTADFVFYLELIDLETGVQATLSGHPNRDTALQNIHAQKVGVYTMAIYQYAMDTQHNNYSLRVERIPLEAWRLAFNTTVTSSFANPVPHQYQFEGTAGQVVSIYASGRMNLALVLTAPSGAVEAFADDEIRTNPLIGSRQLAETGIYTVIVNNRSGGLGKYELSLLTHELLSDHAQFQLSYGDVVQMPISGVNEHRWTFQGNSADRVSLSAVGDCELAVEVHTPAGVRLAIALNSQCASATLENIYLPVTGLYQIVLRPNGQRADENYQLSLMGHPGSPIRLESGTTLSANLPNYMNDVLNFSGSAGEQITILGTSEPYPSFKLYDAAGNYLTDFGADLSTYHPFVLSYELPADGDYSLIMDIHSEEYIGTGWAGGSYTLSFIKTGGAGLTLGTATPLIPGEPQVVLFKKNSLNYYTLDAQAGDLMRVELDEIFADAVYVFSPNNKLLASSLENETFSVHSVEFIAPSDGIYILVVTTPSEAFGDSFIRADKLGTASGPTAEVPPTPVDSVVIRNRIFEGGRFSTPPQSHQFTVNAGEVYFIGIISSISATLTVTLPDGQRQQIRQPVPNSTYAIQANTILMPAAGQLSVEVISEPPGLRGDYSLVLSPVQNIAQLLNPGGNPQTVAMESGYGHLYFEGNTNTTYGFRFKGDAVFSVQLLAPDGIELLTVPSGPGNALDLTDIRFDEPGVYSILLTGSQVQLFASLEAVADVVPTPTPDPSIPLTRTGGEFITIGQTVNGTIGPNEAQVWEFAARTGERISITLQGDFDTYLQLYTSGGVLIAENDDFETILSAIVDFTIPSDDVYTIVVSGFTGATGNYTLALEAGASQ